MTTVQINGIHIEFPFEPYPLQKAYMNQVISCLKNKRNGLLESPTGTGKTLSLLCSSLAWLNQNRKSLVDPFEENDAGSVKIHNRTPTKQKPNKDPTQMTDEELMLFLKSRSENDFKIFFSSRTHSQLSQSIKEMKKSAYSKNTAVVLGSRDQLCLNQDVQKLESSTAKNQACRAKISGSERCPYYSNYESKLSSTDYTERTIFDIEDLVSIGEKQKCCPYFASRKLQEKSDIIFLPYNYLLDPQIRKFQGVDLNNSVIIFDEGHNLEKMCEEAISAEIKSSDLATVIKEIDKIYAFLKKVNEGEIPAPWMNDQSMSIEPEDLALLKQLLIQFESEVDSNLSRARSGKAAQKEFVHQDNWIFNVLSTINMTLENHRVYLNAMEKMSSLLTVAAGFGNLGISTAINAFEKLRLFFVLLFPQKAGFCYETFKKTFNLKFKVCTVIEEEFQKKKSTLSDWNSETKSNLNWILNIWCLTPSIGIKSLIETNVRNIILTSGTLAPLNTFEAEFGIDFPVRLENQHIISPTQMNIFPISQSFDNVLLDSRYQNKDNNKFYRALGNTIVDICHHVPDGILLFFSSYSVKSNCIQRWRDYDREWRIWSKLNQIKEVFEEPKNRNSFGECIESFRVKVDEKRKGAIFIGVCRGKLSEGIDLANQYCRAVIMVGLPFPALKDPRVVLKRQYIDSINLPGFTSSDWYVLQMKRALNQAVGRAIRNKNDYGCVFLLDSRFNQAVNDLSKWCRNFVVNQLYRDMMTSVQRFYSYNSQVVRQQAPSSKLNILDAKSKEKEKLSSNFVAEHFESLPSNDVSNQALLREYSDKYADKQKKEANKKLNSLSKPMFGQSSIIADYKNFDSSSTKSAIPETIFDAVFGSATPFKEASTSFSKSPIKSSQQFKTTTTYQSNSTVPNPEMSLDSFSKTKSIQNHASQGNQTNQGIRAFFNAVPKKVSAASAGNRSPNNRKKMKLITISSDSE